MATTPKKPKPTPKQRPKPTPAAPPNLDAVDFQDVANSLARQITDQASRIAMLEAQNARLKRLLAAKKPDERKVSEDAPPVS